MADDGAGDADTTHPQAAPETAERSVAALRSARGDDFGVVDEPVDHGGGDVVAEYLAPAAEVARQMKDKKSVPATCPTGETLTVFHG